MDGLLEQAGQFFRDSIVSWASSLSDGSLGALAVILALVSLVFLFWLIRQTRSGAKLRQQFNELDKQHVGLSERADAMSLQLSHRDDEIASLSRSVSELRPLEVRLAQTQSQLEALQVQFSNSESQLSALREEHGELKVSSQTREAELNEKRKAMQDKIELLQDSKQQLTTEFQNLANKIFDEKNQRFNQNSKQLLDSTLSPLKNQLDDFRKKVEDSYSNEAKERHLLKSEIEKLRAESVRISEDATNLTQALKADNKAQGNWGEFSLKKALETCGLREGIEFDTQAVYSEGGVRAIPDVVVHLPDGRDIVIDSKVSLLAYTRFFESEDDQTRKEFLKSHLQSVRQHVKDLSGKDYSSISAIQTLDYVMLYIPIEGASSLALQNDLDLMNFAYDKKIILVGPNNLLAILKTVETLWRRDKQNRNAEKIAEEAGKLHDQFVAFAESLEDVGKQIGKAHDAYDKARGRLIDGRGNLVRKIDNLQKLGAKTQKKIPEKLRDMASLEEVDVSHNQLEVLGVDRTEQAEQERIGSSDSVSSSIED